MTVVNGRIAACVFLVAFASCNDMPPAEPTAPPGVGASPMIGGGLEDQPVEPGLGRPDHWSETYGAYMSPELKRDYLATPEEERFDRFGLRLLDFQLREELLLEHQEDLKREEKDQYRRLTSAEACRRFILERSGSAHITSTTRR
jgi:hypothetical protein